MPFFRGSPAWRRTTVLVLATALGVAPRLAADGGPASSPPAAGDISGDSTDTPTVAARSAAATARPGHRPRDADEPADADAIREYARRLEAELERTVRERDRAVDDLEAERAAAKRALDRVLEQSVEREGLLAAGRARERGLESALASAAAERERLLEEIVAEAEKRTRAEVTEGLRRASLIDRMRTAELDRDEAVRLDSESRRAAVGLAEEAETLRGRVHELEEHLARAMLGARGSPETAEAGPAELEATRAQAVSLRAELAAARRELRSLRTARDGLEKALAEARTRRVSPADAPAGEEGDADELHRQLALERERRATLEAEMVRLSVSSDVAERYREAWDALQQARAEVLVLSEKLDQERTTREELQVLLERARGAASARGGEHEAPIERLVEVAESHGRDTERLEADLREASDRIARLRGHLETIEAPGGAGTAIVALEEENGRLRDSLRSAELRIGRLAGQAALARRLAEIVYTR